MARNRGTVTDLGASVVVLEVVFHKLSSIEGDYYEILVTVVLLKY